MNQLSILDIGFVVSRYGDEKLLLQLQRKGGKSKISVPMIGQAILDRNLSNLENLVASETELLIYCKPQYQEKLINDLIITKATDFAPSTSVIELDVCFELSLDWERVCGFLEKEKETIIKLLIKNPYKLINYGFQPGFMYLDGLK